RFGFDRLIDVLAAHDKDAKFLRLLDVSSDFVTCLGTNDDGQHSKMPIVGRCNALSYPFSTLDQKRKLIVRFQQTSRAFDDGKIPLWGRRNEVGGVLSPTCPA